MKRVLALALMLAAAVPAAAATVTNGGFETGTLAGWTVTPTANGTTRVQDVTNFDTTGTGASLAARFQVGQVTFASGVQQGVTLSQSFTAPRAGTYDFSVNVAAVKFTAGANASGGVFSLFVDSILVASANLGSVSGSGAIKRATLTGSRVLAAGTSTVSLLITRPFITSTTTPFQFVDNVSVVAPPAPVPLPAGVFLLLGGFGGLVLVRRRAA